MEPYVELARLGAIGISAICLLLTFKWNGQLVRSAGTLSPDTLTQLIRNNRWTMVFACFCLAIAMAAEVFNKYTAPATVGLEIIPQDFQVTVPTIAATKAVSQPVYVHIAGISEAVPLSNGMGKVTLASGNTLTFDINGMIQALVTFQAITHGQTRVVNGDAGLDTQPIAVPVLHIGTQGTP